METRAKTDEFGTEQDPEAEREWIAFAKSELPRLFKKIREGRRLDWIERILLRLSRKRVAR